MLLNVKTGVYYGLDEVGTRMWSLLAEHGEVEKACRVLLEEYDVTEDRLRADLLGLIERLREKGLVRVYEGEDQEVAETVP